LQAGFRQGLMCGGHGFPKLFDKENIINPAPDTPIFDGAPTSRAGLVRGQYGIFRDGGDDGRLA